MTLTAREARFRAWLLDDYQRRVPSETKMTPMARWTTGGCPPRLPEAPEQRALLLLTVATPRRVQQDGLRFEGFRYCDLTVAGYGGAAVVIRYDPRDLAAIRVLHEDRCICRAVCDELGGQPIRLRDVIRARQHRQRHWHEHITDRTAIVALLLAVHRPVPPPSSPEPEAPPRPRLKRAAPE